MKQAQQMQEKMQKVQEDIFNMKITGESSTSLVKVTINSTYNCHRIEIDPSLIADNKDILEDLIASAFNDVVCRIDEGSSKRKSNISNGMQLPQALRCNFDANKPSS